MLNKIVLQGRLTRDPELKNTSNQKLFCSFMVASERPKYGEKTETDFLPCVAWEKTASFLGNYFHKGDMILISGRLNSRKYDDNGTSRTIYEILVESIDFCGGKTQPQTQQAQTQPVQSTQEEVPFEV